MTRGTLKLAAGDKFMSEMHLCQLDLALVLYDLLQKYF